jgi:hypothetical protein
LRKRTDKNLKFVRDEIALGKHLFTSRQQRSEISGLYLGETYNHVYCSHIIPKGAFPKFRHYYKNIVLMTFEEHQLWDHYRHRIKNNPEWNWLFKLEEVLKKEYYLKKYF